MVKNIGKGGESTKAGGGEVLHKLCLTLSKLKKNSSLYAPYMGYRKEMGYIYEVSRKIIQWDTLRSSSNQTMLYKGTSVYFKNTMDQAYSGLGTDNHSPIWWQELYSQNLKQPFPKTLAPDHYHLCKAYSWFKRGSSV